DRRPELQRLFHAARIEGRRAPTAREERFHLGGEGELPGGLRVVKGKDSYPVAREPQGADTGVIHRERKLADEIEDAVDAAIEIAGHDHFRVGACAKDVP